MKAYQNIQSFDTAQRFSPWIYRIAHNAFVNEMRKTARSPLHLFDFDTLVSHPVYEDYTEKEREDAETKKMVGACLNKLASKYREVIILHYYEELGYKEIADVLQIPAGTVGVRLRRARESMKKMYESLQEKNGN